MKYTLGTAAKATGKSRTAILRAISSGKISAAKNVNGHYEIDASELFRVYTAVTGDSADTVVTEQGATQEVTHQLIDMLERDRKQMQDTIDDLRRRLDRSEAVREKDAEELRRLTLLITHQIEPKQETPAEKAESTLFNKLFGRR